MLAARDVDYRLIYTKEEEFEKRVDEIYIGKQTHKRPPFFIDILTELVDIEAELFLIHHRDHFSDLTDEDFRSLHSHVKEGGMEAIQFVCGRMDENFIELFAKDLYLHLIYNNLSFLEQDVYDREEVIHHNSSIIEVW